jgi:hypothetical protein
MIANCIQQGIAGGMLGAFIVVVLIVFLLWLVGA